MYTSLEKYSVLDSLSEFFGEYYLHGVENYTSQSRSLDEFFADGVLFFARVLFVYTAPIDFRRIYARYPSFYSEIVILTLNVNEVEVSSDACSITSFL